ncbi:unnamed protein product [Cylindrotheca closterium]|uniref:G-patch domain-containing protein n=1 Tax=Cylindrotheca closterium TaxID=2856 RepID=A0AAD2FSB6_9STRA|nr:unnamed protein product [Cylindrotheca closterium]
MSNFDLDDSDNSIIHEDSDDDEIERDDDVDIGFRRHQFETFGNGRPKRRHKEESLYGVFYQEHRQAKRSKTKSAPMFVAASKSKTLAVNGEKTKSSNNFVAKTSTTIEPNEEPRTADCTEEHVTVDEESPDEIKIREEQKAADDYFLSLLNKGRTKQRAKSNRHEPGLVSNPAVGEETAGLSAGLGWGVTSSFGKKDEGRTSIKRKPQSSLGKWEKHTKGIGGKLLTKMGWSGEGGLGSNRRKLKKTQDESGDGKAETAELEQTRKGISRPVDVVVRPTSLGLGFGNFKEASQLKTNRQIEAEVRGLKVSSQNDKKQQVDETIEKGWGLATKSSAIPGADQVMAQKQWKRNRKGKSSKVTIVPYEELLRKEDKEEDGMRIIDMTGQQADRKEKSSRDGQVQLGAEILHNISFLLNTHENKLHSSSHFLRSNRRKCDSFQSDVEEMRKRQGDGRRRIESLKHMQNVVSQVEALTQQVSVNTDASLLIDDTTKSLDELARELTAEEKHSLQFWETIAPAILSPVIQLQLDRWNPLQPIGESKDIVDLIFGLVQSDETNGNHERVKLRDSTVHNQLLPKIKRIFDSTKWIANQHADLALDLYEYILKKAIESCPREGIEALDPDANSVLPVSDVGKSDNRLAASVKRILIFESIYLNIQRSMSLWKPRLRRTSDGLQILDRLDLWVLPWLPHLDHPTMLHCLIVDCRRKIKHAMEYLQRKCKSDEEFLRASIDILKPWRNIFEVADLQGMVSDIVTPRLARHLAKQRLDVDVLEDCTTIFGIALEMHRVGLLADIDFLSVMEGEVLIRWAASIKKSVLLRSSSECAQSYLAWKRLILTNFDRKKPCRLSTKTLALLQEDAFICQIFWSVLRVLQLSHRSDQKKLSLISFPTTNFQVVAARRARVQEGSYDEEKPRNQSIFTTEKETRARLQRLNVTTPTFREVVEEFAKNEGITFQPRSGFNAMKDGRQIFQFGNASIYIEGDVVFTLKGKEWIPVALDQLDAS